MIGYAKIEGEKYNDPVISYLVNLKTSKGTEHITVQGRKRKVEEVLVELESGKMTQELYDLILHRFAKPPRASQEYIDRNKRAGEKHLDNVLTRALEDLQLTAEEAENFKRVYSEAGPESQDCADFYRTYVESLKPSIRKSVAHELERLVSKKHFNKFSLEISKIMHIAYERLSDYLLSIDEEDKQAFKRLKDEKNKRGMLPIVKKYDQKRELIRAAILAGDYYLYEAGVVKIVHKKAGDIKNIDEIEKIIRQENIKEAYAKIRLLNQEIAPRAEKALNHTDEQGQAFFDFSTIKKVKHKIDEFKRKMEEAEAELADLGIWNTELEKRL